MNYSTHRASFLLLLCLVVLGGCKGLKLDQKTPFSASDWMMEGDSPQHSHAVPTPFAPPLEEAWLYNAGAGFGPGSPLIFGNAVLAATRNGEVHAINVENGRRLGFEGFGDAVEGNLLIGNNLLYVPIVQGRYALMAYDLKKAKSEWRVKGAPIESGLLPLDNAVVAVDTDALLRAYDQADGTIRWEHALGDDVQVKATPVLADGLIIVANDRGEVAAFRPADGTVVWTQKLDAPVYRTPSAADGLVFIPTTRGRIYALDTRQGTPRWDYSLPDTTVRFTAPAVDEGQVVFGATDGALRSFEAATGKLQWSYNVDGAITGAPLMTPGHVFFGSMRKRLIAVERSTGKHRWEYELKGRMKSAMAARDGRLVVLTEPRYVYLFKSTEADDYAVSQ